jgi:CPA1 family monovalent cation:H+ antiporter
MRGVVSLAAALGLPLTLSSGEPFPERNLVIFLTFAVILATLVGQGLTLPLLIRRLGIVADGRGHEGEPQARLVLAEAAIDRLGQLRARGIGHDELIDRLRLEYVHRTEHLNEPEAPDATDAAEQERIEHREIVRSVVEAEREALLRLRERGAVSDETFRRLERDLDLAELRTDV